ncbi:hypothetical protein G6F24_018065 [Rhizopus arrhizus]|nr:hypothetical protein G6F24_018065 [Rhizopus arrhizus]
MSITSLDAGMARTLEPRAAAPWRRLETVRTLTEAGVPVGVLVAPLYRLAPAVGGQDPVRRLAERPFPRPRPARAAPH